MTKSIRMKFFLTIFLTVMFYSSITAQSTEDSVKAAVNNMFAAMKNADSAGLNNIFPKRLFYKPSAAQKKGKRW